MNVEAADWKRSTRILADMDLDGINFEISTDRYTSHDYQALERKRVWMKVWQIAGRADELQRGCRRDHCDLVAGLREPAEDLAGLVRSDAPADAEDDARGHGFEDRWRRGREGQVRRTEGGAQASAGVSTCSRVR